MTEPVTTGWTDFALATAGAAAALAGLVMVAISVNIRQILGLAGVSARAAAAIGSLVLVVVSSALILVPGQPGSALGAELLAAAAAAALLHGVSLSHSMRQATRPRAARLLSLPIAAAQLAPLIVGALLLVFGGDGSLAGAALYWVAAGLILTVIGSMLDAWVLMVEILR